MEDIIIIGSGPASYCAALYASEYKPLLFEGEMIGSIGPGGQLTTTTNVDNYPGFPKGVQGPELMENMRNQAIDEGVRIISETINKLTKENGIFMVENSEGKVYKAKSVILGTGASAKRLNVPGTGENEFWQKGISACAVCDGFFFKNGVVGIIGGGDTAMEEAMYMSNIAKKVYLIHRRTKFRARADNVEKLRAMDNVEFVQPAELVSAHGKENLEEIKLENTETKETFVLKVDGLFFAIGHTPNTWFLDSTVKLNDAKYVITNERMHTSVEGLFACGDVQDYKYRQAITAASSGCVAAIESCKYIKNLNV